MTDFKTATINGSASGVWTGEEGTAVEVLERSANGRSSLVRTPERMQRLHKYAKRKCWLPTSWLNEEVSDRA